MMSQLWIKAAGFAGLGVTGAMLAPRNAGLVVEHRVLEGSLPSVFDYMADFSNIAKWDPGVVSAVRDKRTASKETGNEQVIYKDLAQVGDSFSLITVFKGNEQPFKYTITELDRPHRLVLEGKSALFNAHDVIEFSSVEGPDGGVVIDYKLQLTLRGPLRPFTFLLALISDDLKTLGRESLDGFTEACAENAAAIK
mmetsp:Transcript_42595/g.86114  ORF Transcript_42595/g.86114 Transcript_42595/m.86114 type:complete len:196 (+) Transcript_42595:24-611(+)